MNTGSVSYELSDLGQAAYFTGPPVRCGHNSTYIRGLLMGSMR